MPNHLTFTAAPTSRITKRTSKSSFKKSVTSGIKSVLPASRFSTKEKLKVIAANVPLEPDSVIEDACAGFRYLCEKMFAQIETNKLHRNKIAELYASTASVPRVVLLHQLYSLCANHTKVDRELAGICDNGNMQRIMLHGDNEGDIAIMMTRDFKTILENLKGGESSVSVAIVNFEKAVFGETGVFTGVRIFKGQYSQLSETNISTLCAKGLLTLDHRIPGSYTISLPNIGIFMRNLTSGRKEILRILKKQRFTEILEKDLLEKKLKSTLFSWEFHLHDMYGSGRVERFTTPVGPGIKLTSKGLGEIK